jgi:hypothetical protein
VERLFSFLKKDKNVKKREYNLPCDMWSSC